MMITRGKKQLCIMRHAKSAWDTHAATDFDRPLSKRGVRDAAVIGKKMRQIQWNPQVVLCSPAVRTRQTCEITFAAMQHNIASVKWNKQIYHASLETLLHLLAGESGNVMLIGHNPGMAQLLEYLCPDVPLSTTGKLFTTANVAIIEVSSDRDKLNSAHCKILELFRPKELLKKHEYDLNL
jgi:phosphohistidine phosphatase